MRVIGRAHSLARSVLDRSHFVEGQERIGIAQTSRREGTPHDEAAALALTMRRNDFRDLAWLADSGFHDMLRFLFTAVRRSPLRSESRRQARNGGGHGDAKAARTA